MLFEACQGRRVQLRRVGSVPDCLRKPIATGTHPSGSAHALLGFCIPGKKE